MARFWKEEFSASKHRTRMWGEGVEYAAPPLDTKLEVPWVYLVSVCSFTFEFHSIQNIEACLAHFRQKIRPSSRIPIRAHFGGDHWETQRWYDKLPKRLLQEPKRLRVVKALERALCEFKNA